MPCVVKDHHNAKHLKWFNLKNVNSKNENDYGAKRRTVNQTQAQFPTVWNKWQFRMRNSGAMKNRPHAPPTLAVYARLTDEDVVSNVVARGKLGEIQHCYILESVRRSCHKVSPTNWTCLPASFLNLNYSKCFLFLVRQNTTFLKS